MDNRYYFVYDLEGHWLVSIPTVPQEVYGGLRKEKGLVDRGAKFVSAINEF